MNQEKPPEKPSKIEEAAKAGAEEIAARGLKKVISKEALKRAGTWLYTKLGFKALGGAIGGALGGTTVGAIFGGPPGALIGAAISWVAEKIIKPIKKLLSPILVKIKKALQRPEVAIVSVGLGVAAIFLIGAPLGIFIGVPLTLLGGLGLVAGGVLGATAATTGAFLSFMLLSPIGQATTLFITVLVVGTIVGLMALTLFIVITTAGAFIVPSVPTEEVSAFFEVEKTVSRRQISNDALPGEPCVTYRIEVAADQPIEIKTIVDERTVVCDPSNTNNPQVETPKEVPPPDGPITSWSWPQHGLDPERHPYRLCFDETFADCRVCNTVTVTADIVDGETGERASDTQCVAIGEPPEECPGIWPTDSGYITQGPKTDCAFQDVCYSHCDDEAIDIGVVGVPVKATHGGTVTATGGGGMDKYVYIQGDCNGTFSSFYKHLQSVEVEVPDRVTQGQIIGTSGSGGTGPHLHYQFFGLPMQYPNIPVTIKVGCCGVCTPCPPDPCGISW